MRRGTLYGVRCDRAKVRSACTSTVAPGSTTIAAATCSPPGLGSPTTAASVTPSKRTSTSSTSEGLTLNPPVMMSSLMRSTMRTNPSGSIVTMSPVRNQSPSTKTSFDSCGLR